MMDALRAITFSGACCGFSQYLMQQRRAVRATVREERDGAAGDEEPATTSLASTHHQPRKKEQGDGAKHGRPSTIPRQPRTSRAEAATERSEGIAGAER